MICYFDLVTMSNGYSSRVQHHVALHSHGFLWAELDVLGKNRESKLMGFCNIGSQ